jgi:dTDP-4-amino-4,6-dideoxygalactose transaminase
MSRAALGWLPAAGLPVGWRELAGLARERDPAESLRRGLAERLGAGELALWASGREALRALLASAGAASRRDEVVMAAYTCFSVPAAAVAAGMRVRLVDVTEDGQLDAEALARLPLERAAAVVVSNLFGVAEPVAPVAGLARAAGCLVIDDAAQALGARRADGPAGGRGDAGVLSFGRGKPLSGLGGGACLLRSWPVPLAQVEPPEPARWRALARAAAYDAALHPLVFRALAAIPALGIGETRFETRFRRGSIDAASLALAAAALPDLEAAARRRARAARELAEALAGLPLRLLGPSAGETGVWPRLFAMAHGAAARDAALRALAREGAGASGFYPTALDAVAGLRPHLVQPARYPRARELASRLLTLPTHGALRGPRLAAALEALASVASAS